MSASTTVPTPDQSLGLFEGQTAVGTSGNIGSCYYNPNQQFYTVAGFGAHVWSNHDAFQFVWRRMTGNWILIAHVAFVGVGQHPHRRLGLIARTSLDPDSAYVSVNLYGNGQAVLQSQSGGDIEEIVSPCTGAGVLQLERIGTSWRMSVARDGELFVSEEIQALDLGDTLYVGLFVASHDDSVREQAIFRNVRMVVPASESYVRFRDPLGSLLEVAEISTGSRQILFSAPEIFEAPNWTPDGKALIYNSQGRLHSFDLSLRAAMPIDTGFATRCNNDHVISPDGTQLAISHHPEDEQVSIIYTLPIDGGTPTRITPQGPSYLHGWSPDGAYLVYTGLRNGDFDIYRISASGGEEERLTDAPGLDDGPEYSPDGQYIYFNSVRSGSMQIWRMRADGSAQEQITHDHLNNWFPHVSPDGRWIVFLSYADPVNPSDHPPAKRVYLRIMPTDGGIARVLAYLYGGQGTINVPSWSPDSTRIALVSNTAPFV